MKTGAIVPQPSNQTALAHVPAVAAYKVEPTKNRWVEEMYRHPLDTDTARDGRRKRPARSSGLIGAAPTRLAAGPNAGPWRSLPATPARIRALRHRSGLTDPRDPVAPPHGRRPAAMLLAKYGDARSSWEKKNSQFPLTFPSVPSQPSHAPKGVPGGCLGAAGREKPLPGRLLVHAFKSSPDCIRAFRAWCVTRRR